MSNHHSPRHREIASAGRILLTEVGSGLHGVTVDGTDDDDEMGVCIPPPEAVIGLESFEQYADRWHSDGSRIAEGERSHAGDTDHTTYALNKWARLAAQGNPTVLMPLFAPSTSIRFIDSSGEALIANRELFLSKQAGLRFLGYLKAQKERMLGLRGRKHTNRPELVEQFGFDTKSAYHALRLAFQGQQLMYEGKISLPMQPFDRNLLLAVRRGTYNLDWVVKEIETQSQFLQTAMEKSELPDEPNYDELNDWLIGLHTNHWRKRGLI